MDILREDHPQSVRHVFYRMTDPRLPVPVAKTEHGYQQVQARLVSMRKAGRLPYRWISDSSRSGYHVQEYDDSEQFIRSVGRLYRGRLWTAALPHVEVWVESRSIAGVLRETCQDLAVSLYPCGGFPSLSFVHEAAMYINSLDQSAVVVLYVGDFDPSGMLIGDNLAVQLREHLQGELVFRRLAVNEEQIEGFSLPTKPRKSSEKRRPEITDTVEAEAMPANTLRQIVRGAVEAYIPIGQLEAVRAAEASERQYLETFAFAS